MDQITSLSVQSTALRQVNFWLYHYDFLLSIFSRYCWSSGFQFFLFVFIKFLLQNPGSSTTAPTWMIFLEIWLQLVSNINICNFILQPRIFLLVTGEPIKGLLDHNNTTMIRNTTGLFFLTNLLLFSYVRAWSQVLRCFAQKMARTRLSMSFVSFESANYIHKLL